MKNLLFAVVFAMVVGSVGSAAAQNWPSRPLTMVVTFAAGGPNDLLARIMAPQMSEILGQQVIVEMSLAPAG
jgi:tripartite-type tricarboxylate transporter receptor subunit TctC